MTDRTSSPESELSSATVFFPSFVRPCSELGGPSRIRARERTLLSSGGSAPVRPTEVRLEIRIISSLTPEDELRYAQAFVKMAAAVLDALPATYVIHVELSDGAVVPDTVALHHPEDDEMPPPPQPHGPSVHRR